MNPCSGHKPEETIAAHFDEAVRWRRLLHKNPQPAWREFYATGFVAEKLDAWGYDLMLGRRIIAEDKHIVSSEPRALEAEYDRALRSGINERFIAPAKGGYTGVVGTLRGRMPGPTVGFRFDIDSLEILESNEPAHRPAAEGFVSVNPGYAHMCGHDVHTAIGLLLARYFAENAENLRGTVKLIFQPNEEDINGAEAMIANGVVDDLDYLFGGHVGTSATQIGQVALDVRDFLALSRFRVTYRGRSAHAGLRPNEGKNALLGACAAVTNLHAIARHGDGASRINVGTMDAGTTWNVIPDIASFRVETRGATDAINGYMVSKAMDVLEGAAKMHDLAVEIEPAGTALGALNSPELVELAASTARQVSSITQITQKISFNVSEDVTLMMNRVQGRGGKALFVLFGTPVAGGHHSTSFDVDERVIGIAAEFLAAMQAAVAPAVQ